VIETFSHGGLTFDVTDSGPAGGPVVVALHGFPQDRSSWDGLTPALTAAGFRVLAPDLRGYSPGARPRRRRDYRLGELAGDVLALADAAGAERVHLVGHDWGAALGWYLAGLHPHRVRGLVALAVPHQRAWASALLHSGQLLRSWYVGLFLMPVLPEWLFARRHGEVMRRKLVHSGLDDAHARRYAARHTAMTGPLNWYRGVAYERERVPPVGAPTLYVWGERDGYISRRAADRCGRCVTGPYRYEVLDGASHWLPEREHARLAPLVVEHLRAAEESRKPG
jgi:pimeloyl-ACP methyl ester carboxylesterase